MSIQSRALTALESPAPRASLARLMSELLEQGLERDEIFSALENLRDQLISAGRAGEAEHLAEALDGFSGWCRLD